MAKYRDLTAADQKKIDQLKAIDTECKPLKAANLKLREQHLKLCAEQEKVVKELHALGTKRHTIREELLLTGIDPKLLTQLERAK